MVSYPFSSWPIDRLWIFVDLVLKLDCMQIAILLKIISSEFVNFYKYVLSRFFLGLVTLFTQKHTLHVLIKSVVKLGKYSYSSMALGMLLISPRVSKMVHIFLWGPRISHLEKHTGLCEKNGHKLSAHMPMKSLEKVISWSNKLMYLKPSAV